MLQIEVFQNKKKRGKNLHDFCFNRFLCVDYLFMTFFCSSVNLCYNYFLYGTNAMMMMTMTTTTAVTTVIGRHNLMLAGDYSVDNKD